MNFEWDEFKARSNLREHGVSFGEAASIFADPLALEIPDLNHSDLEERYIAVGHSFRGRLLVVVHLEDADSIRIISARLATGRERRTFEEGTT